MTSRFYNKIIPWIFKWEGTVFEKDPDDPGGATKFGIDQMSHLTVERVINFMKKNEGVEVQVGVEFNKQLMGLIDLFNMEQVLFDTSVSISM